MGYTDYESDAWIFLLMVLIIVLYIMRDRISFFSKFKNQSPPTTTRSASPPEQPGNCNPSGQINVNELQRNAPGGAFIKGVFLVITTSDPQTQLMAMSLSTQIVAKGKSLKILLCGPGGDLALRDGKEVILKPINKSPQMLLKNLINNNIRVEICPFYLANRGGSMADLINGITPANPSLVADGLLEPGVKLFTF
ncbi:MAG: hypothetical protein GY749_43175 [Desulfobacteraceae bacterium]|nr:hypothetical protein [Desulfobacteraceae bacterium]